jgi:type IV pilus assembly protein PilM
MGLSLGLGSKSLLVIDPGRHTLKVGIGSVGAKGRSAKLQSVYTVRTGLPPQATAEEVLEKSGELLQEVIKRHNLNAKEVSFAIPGRASFVRQLKIPRVSGDRLNRLIQYEARQQIPFPIEDIILDSHVFETEGPELAVTLVAIRRSIIDQYVDMLKVAGLVPDTIDVTTLALFDAFYPQLKKEEEEMVALVDIGASTTDIVVCKNDRVEFIRSAPQAGDQLTKVLADNLGVDWEQAEEIKCSLGQLDPSIDRQTDPLAFGEGDQASRARLFLSKAFDAIANEIRRTIDFYVSQPDGEPIGKIYLTGGTARLPGIDDFVESRLGISCVVQSPFESTLVNVDELQKEPIETIAGPLLGQCQRNIGDTPLRLNFLPPAIVRRKEFERRRTLLLVEGILVGSFIAASVYMVNVQIDVFRRATIELSEKVEGKGDVAGKIAEYTNSTLALNERFSILQEVGRNRGVVARTISAVAESLPLGESWLTNVRVDTLKMNMEARGIHSQSVVTFKERIQEVNRLRNAVIEEEERTADGGVSFTAVAEIEKNPSAEVRNLRQKLENRGVEFYELYFQDDSANPGTKQSFLVTIVIPEPLSEAEKTDAVMDILQAARDAELGYESEKFRIVFHNFQRLQTGEIHVVPPNGENILKGEMQVSELPLILPSG